MTDTTFADEYFAKHLDNTFWNGLTDRKETLLSMATDDVAIELPKNNNLDNILLKKAICEQAVFIERTHKKTQDGMIKTSGGLDGMNESKEVINKDNLLIAPRAQRLINMYKKSLKRSTIRIGR